MNKEKLIEWIETEIMNNPDIGRKQAEGMIRVSKYIQSEPEETCEGCIHNTGKLEDSTDWCFVCKRGYSDEYEKEGE